MPCQRAPACAFVWRAACAQEARVIALCDKSSSASDARAFIAAANLLPARGTPRKRGASPARASVSTSRGAAGCHSAAPLVAEATPAAAPATPSDDALLARLAERVTRRASASAMLCLRSHQAKRCLQALDVSRKRRCVCTCTGLPAIRGYPSVRESRQRNRCCTTMRGPSRWNRTRRSLRHPRAAGARAGARGGSARPTWPHPFAPNTS